MEQGTEKSDGTGREAAPALVQKLEVTETSPAASVLAGGHAEQGVQWLCLVEHLAQDRMVGHICWTEPECQLATQAFVLATLMF